MRRKSPDGSVSMLVRLTPEENAIVETVQARLKALDPNAGFHDKRNAMAWIIREYASLQDPLRNQRVLDSLEAYLRERRKEFEGRPESGGLDEAVSIIAAWRAKLILRNWSVP